MGLFWKKNDPIARRAKSLASEIAEVEAQIRHLDIQSRAEQSDLPRLRSTTHPNAGHPSRETFLEQVQLQERPTRRHDAAGTRENLGVSDPDRVSFWRRLSGLFRKPAVSSDPKLVNFLAAGSIQGLRPLRYEKRVARNRFLAFTALLILVLAGLLWTLFEH